jgi:UDP-glucose:(heptosyl)LPS alpha-1,3-glucosyltransferase
MRLAIVRQRYNPFGGAERFIERAVRGLQAEGATVTILSRRWSSAATGPGQPQLLLCNPFHIGRLWRDASFAHAACALLARERFDLVQSHERLACCDVFRAGDGVHRQWLAHRSRIQRPLARLATALHPFHRYVLWAERRMFASPRLRAVICNSQMVREDILRHFPIPAERLHVIYNGVDLAQFHPGLRAAHRAPERTRLGIGPADYVYLFVGSGFARKGLPQLLRAFAAAAPAGAHLVVAGADRDLRAAASQAARLGCAARVHLLGGVADVRPLYGAADAFVLPTLYDPFPNAALEALASGLPVLTSTQSGAAEFIEPGRNGFVCDALDAPALARGLAALAALDPGEAAEAARRAVQSLSIEAMAGRLRALYEALLRPAGAGVA